MSDPTPDQVPGAPHPRDTRTLFGQSTAEAAFLEAFQAGRLHHAWMVQGPRGTGKATLAYRIARFLLSQLPLDGGDGLFGAPPPPTTLDSPVDHPVVARMAAQSEPGLRVVTRSVNEKTDRLRDEIVVDDIRALSGFFHLSLADGGRRMVIIDAADDLNIAAANALLKMLEEPPAATTLLLVTHQPSRLLPTIRSRCRILRLSPLSGDDMVAALAQAGSAEASGDALAVLADGSVGAALRLAALEGPALYAELLAMLGSLPQLDRPRALKLSESVAGRGAADRLDLLCDLLDILLARLARHGMLGPAPAHIVPQEPEIFARLAPSAPAARAWAEQAQTVSARLRHGRAVNLDPAALVLDTLIKLAQTARDIEAPLPA